MGWIKKDATTGYESSYIVALMRPVYRKCSVDHGMVVHTTRPCRNNTNPDFQAVALSSASVVELSVTSPAAWSVGLLK